MAKAKKPPRIVALAATKGGVGKTTLSAALAVRAAQESPRVALIDADPSASLETWWRMRGKPDNPQILSIDCSQEGIEQVWSEGWDWLIIDTPPAIVGDIEAAVICADVVLIPTRASAVDLMALDQIEEIVRTHEKRFSYVLNAVEPSARMTAWALEQLRKTGALHVQPIAYRRAYVSAMAVGKSGPEVERGGGCATEIEALWNAIQNLLRGK